MVQLCILTFNFFDRFKVFEFYFTGFLKSIFKQHLPVQYS